MNPREIISVVLIAATISVLSGVVLFAVLGVAPNVGLTTVTAAMVLMVLISVGVTLAFYFVFRRYVAERAINVAMMTLRDDEREVLRQIMEMGGEVRQDDLWRKLRERYSKSKLSALVINLEQKHAITRTRHHRTNILKLTQEFKRR